MYYCQLCDYSTENRSKIHLHHIRVKESGGKNDNYNLVYLCPNCHLNRIFNPESKSGAHSIKTENSIQIIRWFKSSGNRMLQYINELGEECFIEDKNP